MLRPTFLSKSKGIERNLPRCNRLLNRLREIENKKDPKPGLFYCDYFNSIVSYFRFLPLAATRWAAVTVFFGGLRTLLVALPLPLPFSSRPHAVPSSNFINADQSKPSFDILLKSGMSGWGWGLVFSFRRGDDVGSYAVWSCEGSACTVSSWAGAGAYAVGVAGRRCRLHVPRRLFRCRGVCLPGGLVILGFCAAGLANRGFLRPVFPVAGDLGPSAGGRGSAG